MIRILVLAFIQNITFSLMSRSRNRDNKTYHAIAAVLSNGIWFLTMREMVLSEMSASLILPYIVGTTAGSLYGVNLAMWIEKKIGATADGHVKRG